eukprot:jgi/Botrbrau1/8401/Bobra.0237s0022.1
MVGRCGGGASAEASGPRQTGCATWVAHEDLVWFAVQRRVRFVIARAVGRQLVRASLVEGLQFPGPGVGGLWGLIASYCNSLNACQIPDSQYFRRLCPPSSTASISPSSDTGRRGCACA